MIRIVLGIVCAALVVGWPQVAATAADGPAPPSAVAAPARTIILVRHGHYSPDPSTAEAVGPGLSALGVAQARLAGARLAGLQVRFDAIIASSMRRAQDTAAVISDGLDGPDIVTDSDLAECTPPSRRDDITADTPVAQQRACAKRLDRVFEHYFSRQAGVEQTLPRGSGYTVLVCHGNVIRYLVTRALGVDTRAWLEMSLGHASLTTIRIEPDGRYKLIAAGDVGHLPANLHTGASGDPERDLQVPKRRP